MVGIKDFVCGKVVLLSARAENFFEDYAKRIKDDESGMEIVQTILLVLFAVVIAVAVWFFLGDAISAWLKAARKTGGEVKNLSNTSVYAGTGAEVVSAF